MIGRRNEQKKGVSHAQQQDASNMCRSKSAGNAAKRLEEITVTLLKFGCVQEDEKNSAGTNVHARCSLEEGAS